MNLHLTASCLMHVNATTELSFEDLYKAYEQAELFTNLGFEVSTPESLDGDATYTIRITQ